MTDSHRLDHDNPCPSCGENNNGALPATEDERAPEPGDFSICAYCAAILEFDDGLRSRLLSTEAFLELPVEARSELKRAQELIQRLNDA